MESKKYIFCDQVALAFVKKSDLPRIGLASIKMYN